MIIGFALLTSANAKPDDLTYGDSKLGSFPCDIAMEKTTLTRKIEKPNQKFATK
jgi:hypothetical protein